MNCLSAVVLLVALAVANAGLAPIDTAAVIAGPSGTVVRSGLAAPVLSHAAIAAPVLRSGLIAGAPLAYAVPAGSGLEGQWIPDITEKLYDDGSYKPYIYGF